MVKGWTDRAVGGPFRIISAVLVLSVVLANGQTPGYVNRELNIAFDPPKGWSSDILVQYLGSLREDGTRPVLNLTTDEGTLDLSEAGINAITQEVMEEFGGADEQTRVISKRKVKIRGEDALEIELLYSQAGLPTRVRQVYIPAGEQKRSYLFTLVDSAQHFNDSVRAAEAAINSFTVTKSESGKAAVGPGKGGFWYTLLLLFVGLLALAVVGFSAYMLIRSKRPA